jgi:L-ribulose-5-phosphate 3-epimerase
MLTRREFAAAAFLTPRLFAGNRIDRSRLSAITDEIGRSPAASIAFAKQYELRWVELRSIPGAKKEYAFLSEDELRPAAKELSEAGLRVSFLNSSLMKVALPGTEPVSWARLTPEVRDRRRKTDAEKYEHRLDDLRTALRSSRILGVDRMRVFTGWRVEEPAKVYPQVAQMLNEMAPIAAKERIHLLVENEAACNVATCAELAELFKHLNSPWLGINWDPLNGAAHKETQYPDGYRLLPKKRILNVQIKGRSVLPGPQWMDWAAIFQALAKDGYRGQIGLETHIFGDGQIQASHDSMREILKIVEPS